MRPQKTVSEVRRENLERLFQAFKQHIRSIWPNEPERGMVKRFAQTCNISPRYLSHIRNGRKEIGHATARALETGMRSLGHQFDWVVDGWMDNDHDSLVPVTQQEHEYLLMFRSLPADSQTRVLAELRRVLDVRAPVATTVQTTHENRPAKR